MTKNFKFINLHFFITINYFNTHINQFNIVFLLTADDLADHGEKIKMIGRWHNISGSGGVCIAETDDMTALSSWMLTWSPVCDIKCEPIVNDEVARANIQSKPFFLNA